MNRCRRVLLAAAGMAAIAAASFGLSPGVVAAQSPGYTIANVGAYGGEPSIVSDTAGRLYDTTPSGGTITYRSTDSGASWTQVTTADPSSGDDCLATDQSGAVYLCNLNGSAETLPLQADVWKSVDHGQSWTRGQSIARQATVCGTSCSPFGVDRDWVAADLAQNATGCNISMLQSFHTLWVSYSDDNGVTWTPQQAFDAGFGHDASTPFASFTLDNQGNPYYGFANNLNSNPATCSAESTAGTVQSDTSCEYDMYVVWSSDGGKTWDGGGGIIPGSAGRAYRVNSTAETGTHWFPAIAAAAPGRVDVAYLRTTEILPTDPFGKADAGGCAGPQAPGNPPTYPPACQWNLYAGQSVNLTSSPASATWAVTQITTTPMHVGDICNLGIFCLAPSSNRNLLDFIMEDLDQKGCAHIAYADDNTVNMLRAANQTSGACLKR